MIVWEKDVFEDETQVCNNTKKCPFDLKIIIIIVYVYLSCKGYVAVLNAIFAWYVQASDGSF